jgi:hypothetical protein
VRVEPLTVAPECPDPEDIPSLYDRLRPLIGAAQGLPTDLARNHDHYLHGGDKQE